MKKIFILLPLLALSACGYSVFDAAEDIKQSASSELADGKMITATPADTGSFDGISAIGPDNVVFKTGDTFTVSASGDADIIKDLRYLVKDGNLVVGRHPGELKRAKKSKVVITITAPSISSISAIGSGNVSADRVTGDKVELNVAGAGTVSVAEVAAKKLESNIAGSGSLKLAGKADSAEHSIAGSGSIDAVKMASADAEVAIAGSGDVKLTATRKVDASIAGSGNVDVTGGAKCTSSSFGSGKLHCT